MTKGGISIFQKRIRHIQRYRDIVKAFSRNGFGYIADELGLYDLVSLPKRMFTKEPFEREKKTTGERIRLFLEELGPTFVKLGQFASTRPDILPDAIIIELKKLQDDVAPFPYEDVREIIENELGVSIDTSFKSFHKTPIAAASIGQVHEATLHTDERVAVKIQRPNIQATIKTDIEILQDLAILAEMRLEIAARYRVKEMIKEFAKFLMKELDYRQEARNGERIKKMFQNNHHIHVPTVYWEQTTDKVLTMEYVEGIKLDHVKTLREKGMDSLLIAEHFVEAMFQQIFKEGFFHADPHPGNILVQQDQKLIFMDFGMVGHLTPEMKEHLASFVIALMRQQTDGIIKAISEMGMLPENVDMRELYNDLEHLRVKYYDVPISDIHLGEAIQDLFSVSYEHHIYLPHELTLLGKTLLMVEGIVEKLHPKLSIVKMAEPFGRELLIEKYHPKTLAQDMYKSFVEYKELISNLPISIRQLKSIIKHGKIRMEITSPELDRSLKKLDRISNRLSFSIVLLAFSIFMAGLIIGSALVRQSTLLWDIPVIEIGFIVAAFMFLWIIYAILKSGRF
ncbi:ubiquinone biosynthesis protein [Cerasibacillus quisquiliarum]|uniref:ABC transporter n=1 Tax=Cerasibacillus quisquiliarum TaxID=227865 RepID=A0A511UTR0_9BACI|nr:AarF/UbiB family protein [Cerasibacillus quisquiliarum]MBB5145136.1 ubiquinone biosynthesis protein [Cerasibacillus quisquiliarum]GEN29974.1 ABC transporter [Cerasibacillus quisquiliarum]